MLKSQATLSVVLAIKNEEKHLRQALESVKWANEIIIIDDYSTDTSCQIASQYTNLIYQRRLENFSAQKNYGVSKARSEWILILDGDEYIPVQLGLEIQQNINSARTADAYQIPRKNIIFGRWIRHTGWYPNYQTRLFKKNKAQLKGKIHESLSVQGQVKRLKNDLVHYNYDNLEEFLDQLNQYTTLDAQTLFEAGKRPRLTSFIWLPLKEFMRRFMIEKGFLDGWYGFILSALMSYYQFSIICKLWELSEAQAKPEPGSRQL